MRESTPGSLMEVAPGELSGDAHELYARLREESPVRKVVMPGRGLQGWLVTRYADVRSGLADPRLSKDFARLPSLLERHSDDGPESPFAQALSAHMLNMDPPDHTRLRKLVSRAFTARRVEQLRPRITEITEALLAELPAGSEVDLISAFAFPLPITVICELLGIPDADREDFRTWSNAIVSNSSQEQLRAAGTAMAGYLSRLIEAKRAKPSEDLLSALIEVSEEDDRLDLRELISMAFLLLVAGHETTVNLIGNGMLSLLDDPGQMDVLRANPGRMRNAVEEFLRFDGPINIATLRFTTEPVEIGGVTIPAGELVLLSLVSANRDPDRYADADRLDIDRDTAGHMAFGHGIHYCLGAPLARLEAEVAFTALLAKYPNIELTVPAAELVWRESTLIHGVQELPVRLG